MIRSGSQLKLDRTTLQNADSGRNASPPTHPVRILTARFELNITCIRPREGTFVATHLMYGEKHVHAGSAAGGLGPKDVLRGDQFRSDHVPTIYQSVPEIERRIIALYDIHDYWPDKQVVVQMPT